MFRYGACRWRELRKATKLLVFQLARCPLVSSPFRIANPTKSPDNNNTRLASGSVAREYRVIRSSIFPSVTIWIYGLLRESEIDFTSHRKGRLTMCRLILRFVSLLSSLPQRRPSPDLGETVYNTVEVQRLGVQNHRHRCDFHVHPTWRRGTIDSSGA